MNGIYLINKPANMTSFDVVAKMRKIFNEKSIGHTGTLDPNATGLMIVLVGKYTKLVPFCLSDKKQYIATYKYGIKTSTGDIWGETIETSSNTIPSEEELKAVLKEMIGKQKQIPPMTSAIKVNGKKLYEYQRKNIEVKVEPRDIEVYSLECLEFGEEVKIKASVSSGTYIRTLIEDIAAKTNNIATMTSLVRTDIDNISLEDAIDLDKLTIDSKSLEPNDILKNYPFYECEDVESVKNGKQIRIDSNEKIIMVTYQNEIIAAYENIGENNYKCKRGLW